MAETVVCRGTRFISLKGVVHFYDVEVNLWLRRPCCLRVSMLTDGEWSANCLTLYV
jgi:hypothetical protein